MPISEAYNEDCMIGMGRYPDKFWDLAICDPPYGLGLDMVTKVDGNTRLNKRRGAQLKHNDNGWNDNIPPPEYFEELHRVSKHQIIWGCNYYAKFIPAVGRIVHDKKMNIDGTSFKWSEADLASCSLFKRIVMYRYRWAGNKQGGTINWENSGQDGRIHPTQKPVSLYKYCLGFAKPGWKILDTHMGSQSSRIAAYQMGFDYYGWEIDKEYFEAGNKRFKEQTAQLKLL